MSNKELTLCETVAIKLHHCTEFLDYELIDYSQRNILIRPRDYVSDFSHLIHTLHEMGLMLVNIDGTVLVFGD